MKSKASASFEVKQIYLLTAALIVATLAIGYLPSGTQSVDTPANLAAGTEPRSSPGGATGDGRALTPEQMKQLADRQASPLIERLQSDPNNGGLLAQVGAIYHIAHQYPQAGAFYGRAVKPDPRNVALRTKLASSLYRSGDADGAIAELNRALNYDANDANALFDLGVIRFEGKGDRKGAMTAWKRLLKSNPQLSAERKATVEKMMAEASVTPVDRRGFENARGRDDSGSISR